MQIELKRLQHETGITFIFVTHDQEEALTMSDRIAVMSQGKILQVGTPARHLRPSGRALRRRLHRRDQFPRGRAGRAPRTAGAGAAGGAALEVAGEHPEGAPRQRQGHGGRPARARAAWPATGGARLARHRREHRLFRHRHALSSCGWPAASRSSCASRTASARRRRLRGRATGVGIADRRPMPPQILKRLSMASAPQRRGRRRERHRTRWLLLGAGPDHHPGRRRRARC